MHTAPVYLFAKYLKKYEQISVKFEVMMAMGQETAHEMLVMFRILEGL